MKDSNEGREFENRKIIYELEEQIEKGYLLHGSRFDIEGMIEPRPAKDGSGHEVRNLTAVYATNKIPVALAMAMLQKDDPSKPGLKGWDDDGENYIFFGENTVLRPGFIYMLPVKSFQTFDFELDDKNCKEIVSYDSVMPIKKYQIEPDILNVVKSIQTTLKIGNKL